MRYNDILLVNVFNSYNYVVFICKPGAMEVTEVDARGWQVGKTITQSLSHILENQTMCDVTFYIRDEESSVHIISAHKLILNIRSPVFEAMFSGNFAESSNKVEIVDADVSTFKEMLR